MFNKKAVTKVIRSGQDLSQAELDAELASMSQRTKSALIQLITTLRDEYPLSAAQQAQANNPLAMASDNGAYEALTGLIAEIDERSKPRE